MTKKDALGVNKYDRIISLRFGEKIVFKDTSFAEAGAGLIELYHVFNLQYPTKADDGCQFMQRILCNFGPKKGARIKRNLVKKWYIEFAVSLDLTFYSINRLYFQGFVAIQ